MNDDGVDIDVNAELQYPNGGLGKIKISASQLLENTAIIKGTKGQIMVKVYFKILKRIIYNIISQLKSFWSSNCLVDVDGKEKTWKFPEPNLKINFINSTGLCYEAIETRKCILNNKLESEDMSHEDSLLLAHIEDEFRRQIGVKYNEDN